MSNKWSSITREDINKAIDEFVNNPSPYNQSKNTFLIVGNNKYPAKHIRRMAYIVHYKEKPDEAKFSGGLSTKKFFEDRGYTIEYTGSSKIFEKNDKLYKAKISVVLAINSYVEENGIVEKDNEGIREILREKGVMPDNSFFQNPDLCYNRLNKDLYDSFYDDIHLYEYVGRNRFRLLGENYNYSGKIYTRPDGYDEDIVVGEWKDGEIIYYDPHNRDNKSLSEAIGEEFELIEKELDEKKIVGKEKEVLRKERVNQGKFRESLLKRYKKCCLCSISNPELLIASHIKPWASSTPEEKVDVHNGLLLCPAHDKLFDLNYISFKDSGDIIISDKLSADERLCMNVDESLKIKVVEGNLKYLKYNRNHLK